MPIAEDLAIIARQEAELRFPHFDYDTAWRLGLSLRELALFRQQSIVVDIRRFGQPHQPLFYTALSSTTPDNQRWVQRKINVVARFHRPSYAIGLLLEQANRTFSDRYNLPDADYAPHGGCFPIHVSGTGIVGAITISGLPQRDDHNLAVEALCLELKPAYTSLRLPSPSQALHDAGHPSLRDIRLLLLLMLYAELGLFGGVLLLSLLNPLQGNRHLL